MNIWIRTGIVLVLCIIVSAFCSFLPSASVSNETGVILDLPENIEGYTSQLVKMSPKESEWLPVSTKYIKRSYTPLGSPPHTIGSISLSLIVSGGDERSLHRPEVCMDGQGWDIPYKKVRPINIDGETLEVMDLELVREVNGQILKAHYYFFWVGMGTSTPSYASMKWMNMWDNFTKNLNHRWAYPGMFVYENPNAENPRLDAWERGKVILKSAIPVFHKDFRTVEK